MLKIEETNNQFWILNRLPLGIFVLNSNYEVLFWNKVMRDWSGIHESDIVGDNLLKRFPEADKPKFIRRISTIFEGGPPAIFSSHLHRNFIEMKTSSGQVRLHNTTVTALTLPEMKGQHLALITIQDVTELNTRIVEYRKVKDQVVDELKKRKEIEKRLRKEKRFISLLLDSARVLIVLLDKEARIIIFNRACEELTGYDSREIEGKKMLDFLISINEQKTIASYFMQDMLDMPEEHEAYWIARDGEQRLISWSNSLVYDEIGRPEFVLSTGVDITDQRMMQEKIRHMAMHDELTGLANRNLLQERLTQNMALADRYSKKLGILFMDLNGFKKINDQFGHRVGDLLLQEVASRITKIVRASDTVARFGGDEFVVVLPEIKSVDDAISVSDKISCDLARPFEIAEGCVIGVSIGISVYPDDGKCAEDIIQQADKAMYQAKNPDSCGYHHI